MREIYNLRNDTRTIQMIQEVSLDSNSSAGYKVEEGLLFGTNDWFKAVEKGAIRCHTIKGKISKMYLSGHNDFPEFEIENKEGKTTWRRMGVDNAYKVGEPVELTYVEQKYKRPSDITGLISKCIIEIKIGEV